MSTVLDLRLRRAFVFLWLVHLAQGALVISQDEASTQEHGSESRILKKRSTKNSEIEVQSMKVDCTVASRFAHTIMTSTALNKANESREIFFEVNLPKTAFITNFSMEIEGQTYVGNVKEKEKAKKQYEKAVSSGQTAGLVKASGRAMEKFSVSVNIAAHSNVTFILTHEELLKRKLGQYEIQIQVKPDQLVQNFQIVADIYEPQGIRFVDAHGTFVSNELLPLVEKTVTDKKAHISFSPTLEQQRKCSGCDGTLIDGDFFIKYDVNRPTGLGDIQIVNGYFVHYFAPPDLPRVPKNVVFIIDRSGSMSGTKMRQTREALLVILQDLHKEDFFAIIIFDHRIEPWKPNFTKASEENVNEAMEYVKKIVDYGSTNIDGAMKLGMHMLSEDRKNQILPERSVDMVILLTDGMPNEGQTHLPTIQQNVREAAAGNISVFCLGFGNGVDYNFLDVMAKQNNGVARRIYEASDATLQMQGFYDEVASPLLSEVDLRYPGNTVDSLTTNHFNQLFNGSELVVAGRLMDNDIDNFLVEVFGQGFEEDFQVHGQASTMDWDVVYPEQEYIFGDFTERLWAYLTIQQLLEKSETGVEKEKSNATAKALEMSLQYNFVTPLTSMVVTKPETEDGTESPLIADKLTEDQQQKAKKYYDTVSVASRGSSRSARLRSSHDMADADGDPHFIIELPEREDALCFNIDDSPGTIFNLVKDPHASIVVNGELIGKKQATADGKVHTYFGRFGIVHRGLGLRLEVTTEDITIFQDGKTVQLLWLDSTSLKGSGVDLQLVANLSLTVRLKDSVEFMVLLHTRVWKKRHYQQQYLGFYTLDGHLLSPAVHGLLGQFYHGVEYEVEELNPAEGPEQQQHATLHVKGQQLSVTRHWQKDFKWDVQNGSKVPCWFVQSNGTGLIDGSASDYVVSGLFKTV